MATTTPTHVDTSIPEVWARRVFRKHKKAGYWGRFIGDEMSGAPIIQKTELLGPGDLLHIQTTDALAGAGVEGDTATLEGNEENLATSEFKCSPVYYRHGVRTYRRAQKKSIVDLRAEAQMRLAEWGMVKMDTLRFTQFAASSLAAPLNGETYTPNIHTCGGTDGSPHIDDIVAADNLTVEEIQKIRVKLEAQNARPVEVDGHPVYFLVTHPNSMFQLKREPEYRDWVREAQIRGDGNPFFRGAIAMIDGIVLHSHDRVPTATNAGSVLVSKGIAFGAEFAVEALDEGVDWDEDVFDYGNQLGVAYGFAFQPRRALEQNSIQVYAAAVAVS
jgi:N4-gp56 family major capsid protein